MSEPGTRTGRTASGTARAVTTGAEVTTANLGGFTYAHRAGGTSTTLMLLHGTGGDEFNLLGLGAHLAPEATLLCPRGRAPEGQINRWFARFAPGVLDEEDIVRRAEEVAGFVAEASGAHTLDGRRIWAVGYSNGANMAAAVMLLHPEIFAGAILIRPMLPLEPETVPDLSDRSVYVAGGTMDTMIPRDSTEALISLLRDSGARVTEAWAEAGHAFDMQELDHARAWVQAELS